MLKKRISAALIYRDGIIVQSIGFHKYLPIGRPEVSVEFLNQWGIDEIILLDITASREMRRIDSQLVKKVSGKCFVPLTVGGGIQDVEDIRILISCGADKVAINSQALKNPSFISEGARVFGNQCIVVSIDARQTGKKRYEVYGNGGQIPTGWDVKTWARKVESLGAGEILLTSIEQDGAKKGYDLELIKQVSDVVGIPVIALGGAGHPRHFYEVLTRTKAAAAAAGNYLHFTEHSVATTKSYLINKGLDIRLDTYANYTHFNYADNGRVEKKSDEYLEKLRFEYISEEII